MLNIKRFITYKPLLQILK